MDSVAGVARSSSVWPFATSCFTSAASSGSSALCGLAIGTGTPRGCSSCAALASRAPAGDAASAPEIAATRRCVCSFQNAAAAASLWNSYAFARFASIRTPSWTGSIIGSIAPRRSSSEALTGGDAAAARSRSPSSAAHSPAVSARAPSYTST